MKRPLFNYLNSTIVHLAFFLASGLLLSSAAFSVTIIEVKGVNRTSVSWLKEFISFNERDDLSDQDLIEIKEKLMTSGAFKTVRTVI